MLNIPKKQKKFYSGKKIHSLNSQVTLDKKSRKITTSTAISNGRKNNLKLFEESNHNIHKYTIKILIDPDYQVLKKIRIRAELLRKKSIKYPLGKDDKQSNQKLASERVLNENFIVSIKSFKIVTDRYRSKHKKYQLKFNLISAIYNMETTLWVSKKI